MNERLPESPHYTERKEAAPVSSEISQETQKIAEGVEALDVQTPAERPQNQVGEQWAQQSSTSSGQQAVPVSAPVDTRIPLPATVQEMQKLVRTEIKGQMATILRDVQKSASSSKFSAHEMNSAVAKLRKLKNILKKLVEFSRDKLKEILFTLVSPSRYVDPEEEKR